jgi:hypothetical protein
MKNKRINKRTEYKLEQQCCDYARSRGIAAVKLEGQDGIPDRLFIGKGGKCLFVEFKKPGGGGVVSQEQMFWLDFLGESAIVCDNFCTFVGKVKEVFGV